MQRVLEWGECSTLKGTEESGKEKERSLHKFKMTYDSQLLRNPFF